MEYLKNNICKFTPLFKINYNKKTNIVSTCFFKLEGGSYKNFNKYINGLYKLNNYVKKNMKYFKIRLFIDESIYNDKKIMKKINSLNKIQSVLINCKNFKSKKNKNKHRGLLGTLFRFFPMFNFKNNDANFVIISDIDWTLDDYIGMSKTHEYYLYLKKNKYLVDLFIIGKIYKSFIHNYKYKRGNIYIPYTIADRCLNNKRINKKILINFIKNNDNNNKKLTYYKKNIVNINKKFIFGVDEYFLNKIMIDYLFDNNKKIGIVIKLGIAHDLYYIFKNINNINKEKKKIYINFFKIVLKDIDNFKFKNIKHAIKFFDNLVYITDEIKKLSLSQIKVFINIYSYFIYNFNNKNIIKLFFKNRKLIELFIYDNNYFGIVYQESLKFVNSKYKGFIKKKLKLPNNIIKDLKKIRNKYIANNKIIN